MIKINMLMLRILLVCGLFVFARLAISQNDISHAVSSDSTTGVVNSIILTSSVDKKNRPGFPIETFLLNEKIFVYMTLGDLIERQPKSFEIKWYNCDKLVAVKRLTTEPLSNPHNAWFEMDASELGSGTNSVDIFTETGFFARSVFQVKNKYGSISHCNGVDRQQEKTGKVITIDVSPNVTFLFGKYNIEDVVSGGHEVLRETIRQLRTNIASIRFIDIVGHSDNIDSDAINLELSKQRAQTVANIFSSNGFGSIRAVGVASTQPIVNCGISKYITDALIACNAPNRRVQVRVSYDETVKSHLFVR